MTENEAKQILIAHNEWRRGGEGEMQDPKLLGVATDKAVESLSLDKEIRNVRQCSNYASITDCGSEYEASTNFKYCPFCGKESKYIYESSIKKSK